MNLQNIEIEHIKMVMPQDYLIMALIAILLIGITFVMISRINKLSISSNNKTAKVLSQIILVLLLSNIAVLAIPQEIKKQSKRPLQGCNKKWRDHRRKNHTNKQRPIYLPKENEKERFS